MCVYTVCLYRLAAGAWLRRMGVGRGGWEANVAAAPGGSIQDVAINTNKKKNCDQQIFNFRDNLRKIK